MSVQQIDKKDVPYIENWDNIGILASSRRKIIPFRHNGEFAGIGNSLLLDDNQEKVDATYFQRKWKKPSKKEYLDRILNIDNRATIFKFENPKDLLRWYLDPLNSHSIK